MSNKKSTDEQEYIIDRLTRRNKKKRKPDIQKRKREAFKRSVDDSTTTGLGCWFFLILPFVLSILMLIILIGLSQ